MPERIMIRKTRAPKTPPTILGTDEGEGEEEVGVEVEVALAVVLEEGVAMAVVLEELTLRLKGEIVEILKTE